MDLTSFQFTVLTILVQLYAIDGVHIFVAYGPTTYFRDDVKPDMTIGQFKKAVAQRVGIKVDHQQVIDPFANPVQNADGYGELIDSKTLQHYGYSEQSKGKMIIVLENTGKESSNCQTDLSIVFGNASVVRIPLNGNQNTGQLKQWLAKKFNLPEAAMFLSDFYPNPLLDGGIFLDTKTLGDYGFTTGSKSRIAIVSVFVPTTVPPYNTQSGNLSISYSSLQVQGNLPIDRSATVGSFRNEVFALTGIPPSKQLLFDFLPNKAQNDDNGIWQDHKLVSFYVGISSPRVDLTVLNAVEPPSKPHY